MKRSPIERLAAEFLERASEARRIGLSPVAEVWTEAARVVEQAIMEHEFDVLTVREAAELSGYSAKTIRSYVQDGHLTNMGRKGSPRVKRGELPRKPRHSNGRSRLGVL